MLDTIGFITDLPHELIESFKSTLEEVANADLVLHVRDVSHPNHEDQKRTVLEVLKELNFEHTFYTKKMVILLLKKKRPFLHLFCSKSINQLFLFFCG